MLLVCRRRQSLRSLEVTYLSHLRLQEVQPLLQQFLVRSAPVPWIPWLRQRPKSAQRAKSSSSSMRWAAIGHPLTQTAASKETWQMLPAAGGTADSSEAILDSSERKTFDQSLGILDWIDCLTLLYNLVFMSFVIFRNYINYSLNKNII